MSEVMFELVELGTVSTETKGQPFGGPMDGLGTQRRLVTDGDG